MIFRLPIEVGDSISFDHVVTRENVAEYAAITTDFSPNHIDSIGMKDSAFGGDMVHGALLLGLMSAASTKLLETRTDSRTGATPVSLGFDKVRFLRPVTPGDKLRINYEVVTVDPDRLRIIAQATVSTSNGLCAVGSNTLKWVVDSVECRQGTTQESCREDFVRLERLVRSRWSCRAFLSTPVPISTLESIFTLAQAMPSGCNSQPWHATLLSGESARSFARALADHAIDGEHNPDLAFPREYRGVYRERRRSAAIELYRNVGVAKGDRTALEAQRMRNFEFFGAPHIAIITTDEALGPYGVLDCGIYVGALLLGAEAMGLAAIPQGAPAEHSDFIRNHLGIGSDRHIICSVSFGYADTLNPANRTRTDRADIGQCVTWMN